MQRDPMLPMEYVIVGVKEETADVFTIDLVPKNNLAFPRYQSGQFNMISAFGVGEVPISMSGDPNVREKLIHTIRAVGPVTAAIKKMQVGDTLGIRGPYGSPWPVSKAIGNDVILVAGGIGLAPLRPVLYEICQKREQYGKITVFYGARTPADILFPDELAKWNKDFGIETQFTVDRAGVDWKGNVGVVTQLMSQLAIKPTTIVMICGPEIMMKFTIASLKHTGLPLQNIYLSMERNMKCGIGFCGHCQFGPFFICKDGPVFNYKLIEPFLSVREI